jgi:predicted MFS family arabinose efflux permease
MRMRLPLSFARLAWANLAAQSAEQVSLAATPIIAVLALNAGPGEIGFLAAVQTLPFLLLSIPLGITADRMSRRRLLIGAEALRASALLAILMVLVGGWLSIGLLAALGFAGAVGTVGFSVAAPALVPTLVPRDLLGAANGRLELARSVAFAAGPALGGALVASSGAPPAFVLAALLSGSAIAMLYRISEPTRQSRVERHPWSDIREGGRLVWREPLLRPILLTAAAWNTAWFVLQAVYVPYAMRVLGLSAGAVGLTLAAYGAGMIVGALLAPALLRRLRFGPAVLIGPLVSVVASATVMATLWWPLGQLAAAAFFLFGIGPIVWTISSTTLRQTLTPASMLGRVSAIFLTVNAGARPVGAALGGFIGANWGEPACLVVALCGFVLQAAFIVTSKVRVLKTLPLPVAA